MENNGENISANNDASVNADLPVQCNHCRQPHHVVAMMRNPNDPPQRVSLRRNGPPNPPQRVSLRRNGPAPLPRMLGRGNYNRRSHPYMRPIPEIPASPTPLYRNNTDESLGRRMNHLSLIDDKPAADLAPMEEEPPVVWGDSSFEIGSTSNSNSNNNNNKTTTNYNDID